MADFELSSFSFGPYLSRWKVVGLASLGFNKSPQMHRIWEQFNDQRQELESMSISKVFTEYLVTSQQCAELVRTPKKVQWLWLQKNYEFSIVE